MFVERISSAKAQLFDLLEHICQEFELTNTQYETAKQRYEAVGEWLARSNNPFLFAAEVYAHGSIGLLTANKPIKGQEHDVDLIVFAPAFPIQLAPSHLKHIVGARLREHALYERLLEEKPRCWRLNYAGELYLDVTPSIRNPYCSNGGELVPEKRTDLWKASNPKGYRSKFELRAALMPRFGVGKMITEDRAGTVADFPAMRKRKGVLRRTVQICKRHRDVFFLERDDTFAPISIIITTLAARSYEYCVGSFVYDAPFDLLVDVVARMPDFIDGAPFRGDGGSWAIWNETTQGENFAEKWNVDPELAAAFFEWHSLISADLAALSAGEGLDKLGEMLGRSFGAGPVSAAMDAMTRSVSSARSNGRLSVAPAAGLTVGTAPARATPVPPNSFFGR
jgi:hypothetical protein